VDIAAQRQSSVQEFIAFLRVSGIPEDQLPTFQKVAEQLLLATGAPDLMSVSAEQANAWRESLRTKNPTEKAMALVARGLASIQAFQRRRSAPAVAAAMAPAKPPVAAEARPRHGAQAKPVQSLSGAKKWAAVFGLLAVVVGSVVYTVVASRKAALENRSQGALLAKKNADRAIGIFYPSYTFTLQPVSGCAPGLIDDVNRAVRQAKAGDRGGAEAALEGVLTKAPTCVSAARVLTVLAQGNRRRLAGLRARFTGQADASTSDAAAQLMAAYAVREVGDGVAYKKYLDRTIAASATQPLVDNALGSYYDLFAQPREFPKELAAYRRELERSGDLATMGNLMIVYQTVHDYERAADLCRRYYAAVPDETSPAYARICLQVAIARGDQAEEKTYLQRYWSTSDPEVGPACMHEDLAGFYLMNSCRIEDAMHEAETAIQDGCVVPGFSKRRTALGMLGRWQAAAEPPPGGQYFVGGGHGEQKSDPERYYSDYVNRAEALAMLGQDAQALDILRPIADRDDKAQVLIGMIDERVVRQRLGGLPGCARDTSRADLLAVAAGGYIGYQLLDDARPLLDEAFKLDPRSPRAWAVKLLLLQTDGKLEEAVKEGEAALAMGIDDPTLAGNLGYAFQQLGQCDKAIPLFKKKMIGDPWGVPNYTNLARCLESTGRNEEAAVIWRYVQGGRPRVFWWMYVLVAVAALGLYFGAKLALIKLFPKRFGHLSFP
jgi:tetratricopeptide (TPR) repeat protein